MPPAESASAAVCGDEGDEDEFCLPVVHVGHSATIEDYQEALKLVQTHADDMRTKYLKLRREVAILKANQKKRCTTSNLPSEIMKREREIAVLSRSWTVVKEIFIEPHIFKQGQPAAAHNDPNRFKTKASIEQGIVADLYNHVPQHLHELMVNHSHFGNELRKASLALRSSVIHTLRSCTGTIFDMPARYFSNTRFDRASVKELENLCRFPGEQGPKYPTFAPVLYPDLEKDQRKLFQSEKLMKILRVTLFGISSLQPKSTPKPRTNGILWGVTHTTPGAIAFAAVMARFLVSPDYEFGVTGAQSQIDYAKSFVDYKAVLFHSSNHIKETFRLFDQFVFEGSSTMHSTQAVQNGDNGDEGYDDIIRALEMINAEDSDDDSATVTSAATSTDRRNTHQTSSGAAQTITVIQMGVPGASATAHAAVGSSTEVTVSSPGVSANPPAATTRSTRSAAGGRSRRGARANTTTNTCGRRGRHVAGEETETAEEPGDNM